MYSVINTDEDIEIINGYLTDDIYLSVSRDRFATVMHVNATKSKGLAALANYWGINQAEIVTFGDDLNDMDLLQYAGIGVAMGNAVDEIKTIADEICLDNDDDGFAKWLFENVLV
jgi:hydroxymethylpyrimidine pyrophosphatase-like HAD family hydrolase